MLGGRDAQGIRPWRASPGAPGGPPTTIHLPPLNPSGPVRHAGVPEPGVLNDTGRLRHTALGRGGRTLRTHRRTVASTRRLPPGIYFAGMARGHRSTDSIGAGDPGASGLQSLLTQAEPDEERQQNQATDHPSPLGSRWAPRRVPRSPLVPSGQWSWRANSTGRRQVPTTIFPRGGPDRRPEGRPGPRWLGMGGAEAPDVQQQGRQWAITPGYGRGAGAVAGTPDVQTQKGDQPGMEV